MVFSVIALWRLLIAVPTPTYIPRLTHSGERLQLKGPVSIPTHTCSVGFGWLVVAAVVTLA